MDIAPIIRTDFLRVNKDSSLSQMIGQLKQSNKRYGLVFDGQNYLGIIQRKNLLKTRLDSKEVKIAKHLTKAPLLSEHANIIETAHLMYNSNLDFIPVERKSTIIGVIEAKDLASLALLLPEAQLFTVGDLSLVYTKPLQKNDSVAKALEIMHQESVDQIPIFDLEKIYGIISYRDLLKKYFIWPPKREFSKKLGKAQGGAKGSKSDMPHLASLPVSSFSTNDNLITTNSQELVREVMKRMQSANVTCALVVDNGRSLGLITVKNILRAIASLDIEQKFNIRFIGLSKLALDDYEIKGIKKIASNEAFKLQRTLQNDAFSITAHVKEYSKTGSQHKYSVHLRIESLGELTAVDQYDWDIKKAFHKAFANAQNKVKHDLGRRSSNSPLNNL